MRINRRLPGRLAWIGFLAIVGFFLLTEHRAHLFGWWPLLLLLACPLLHVFWHGSHGVHGNEDDPETAMTENRQADAHPGHEVGRGRIP